MKRLILCIILFNLLNSPLLGIAEEEQYWKDLAKYQTIEKHDLNYADIDINTLSEKEKEELREVMDEKYLIEMAYHNVLWETYANPKYYKKFESLSTSDWYTKWLFYKNELLKKAEDKKFSVAYLKKCIESIEPNERDKKSLVPVAAFLAKNANDNIWIILCVWEFNNMKDGETGEKIIGAMGHICGWVIDEKSQKEINFFTCD